jgi:site-specific DNA-adenine methylase
MQYMGGKQRIAQRLADYIQTFVDERQIYVEPFVGSAAVMCKIKAKERIGSDINEA